MDGCCWEEIRLSQRMSWRGCKAHREPPAAICLLWGLPPGLVPLVPVRRKVQCAMMESSFIYR